MALSAKYNLLLISAPAKLFSLQQRHEGAKAHVYLASLRLSGNQITKLLLRRYLSIFTFCILYFAFYVSAPAQASTKEIYITKELAPREFDEKDWQKAIEGIDYSSDMRPRENQQQQTEEQTERPPKEDSALAKGFFKVLLIVGGIAVLALTVYFVITEGLPNRGQRVSKKKKSVVALEELEENLEYTDPGDFLQQAIAEGRFNLALRLYYLTIIRELSLKKVIQWKRDKTNRDYLREAQSSGFSEQFREFTRIFERIWYGEQRLEQQEFVQLQPQLEQFIQHIRRTA